MNPRLLAWGLGAALAACASSPPSARAPASRTARTARGAARAPVLTAPDQARELAATRRGVTAMRWDVQRQLTRARARGDRAEASCLDEQLSQLDASLRMLDEQADRFEGAASSGDEAARARSFGRAMALRGRAAEVGEDARRCAAGVVTEGTVTTMVVTAP